MKALIAFVNILKKDIHNYYLKPPNISWGIIFPFAWALMQIIRSAPGNQATPPRFDQYERSLRHNFDVSRHSRFREKEPLF
mgnify:CR=1 FL=1